jgi:hypothetical protein
VFQVSQTNTFHHAKFQLVCGARPLQRGRFAPTLVISRQAWPTRPRSIDMSPASYPSEHTAIGAAYAHGLSWIDSFAQSRCGDPPSVHQNP